MRTEAKRILIGLLLILTGVGVRANDTIARTIVYADTFKLQEQTLAMDEETLYLLLLEQQGRAIHKRDSLYKDSVLLAMQDETHRIDLMLDSLMALRSAMRDSISSLRTEWGLVRNDPAPVPEPEEEEVAVPVDSILMQLDSIARVLSREKQIHPAWIQKSFTKDAQADLDELNEMLHQRKYWQRELRCMATLTQNYSTPNWYKGGNSSLAVLAQVKGYYNYKKDNIIWENTLDWKAGAATTGKSDTLRHINVTDDLFRVRSQFGYQVVKKLYVSASMELNTTLFNSWNANEKSAKTAFFTPFKFYINGGVNYKPIKGLSIDFSPTVYRFVFACFDEESKFHVDVTKFGLKAGERKRSEFGSSVRVNWDWQPLREIALSTEFYLYTNYHAVELELEVECSFIVNRFITTFVRLYPRYDSNYILEGDTRAKMQFQEHISVGFSHRFR